MVEFFDDRYVALSETDVAAAIAVIAAAVGRLWEGFSVPRLR